MEGGQLEITTINKGNGVNFPQPGNRVTVHYTGKIFDSLTLFDSSYRRQEPFSFNLGKKEVIRGWDEILPKMSLGEKARVVCPAEYGYGEKGVLGVVPAGAILEF